MVVVRKQKTIGEDLVERGYVSRAQIDEALEKQKEGERIGETLIRLNLLDEATLLPVLAENMGVSYKTLAPKDIAKDVLTLLPDTYLKSNLVLPVKKNGSKLTVAMEDPLNMFLVDEIQMKTKTVVKPILSMRNNILFCINELEKLKREETEEKTQHILEELDKVGDAEIELEEKKDEDLISSLGQDSAPIVKGVNAIIVRAVQMGASDIHIEPFEKEIKIRYRVDGVLIIVKKMPINLIFGIASRIKIMSDLDIAEKRLPQDGRFRIKMLGRQIDFRVSTLPTVHGEKIVMRILDQGAVNLDLATLGFSEEDLAKVDKVVKSPYGIILVTGPTGSGKSTTLYSVLKLLNKPDVNISTAEDPVEYNLEGINQVQCKPDIGYTFAAALRSFLRQDPDIIMVGEIRDFETAEIAIKAALTGHLVLSTLHTNDAPSSVHRLINMGIEPFMISASILMIQAQRLVRRVCPHCKIPDPDAQKRMDLLGLDPEEYKDVTFYIGEGCETCGGSGYKGRTLVYEVLVVDEKLKESIAKAETTAVVREIARDGGMLTLRECGIKKSIQGITSLEEVLRVTLA